MTILIAAGSMAMAQNTGPGGMGMPKISELPLPCHLKAQSLPVLFGVKLGMPIDDAKKLYAKVPQQKINFGPDAKRAPNLFMMMIPVRYLPKNTLGLPVESLDFVSIIEKKVESMTVKLASKETLSSREMFAKISTLLSIAPEMWLLVDHDNGYHMSWRAECEDFHAQFDAQKGLFYRIWIGKTLDEGQPDEPPVSDGK
jgi:hypothetical protein